MTKEIRVPDDPRTKGSDLTWRAKVTLSCEEKVQGTRQKGQSSQGLHIYWFTIVSFFAWCYTKHMIYKSLFSIYIFPQNHLCIKQSPRGKMLVSINRIYVCVYVCIHAHTHRDTHTIHICTHTYIHIPIYVYI